MINIMARNVREVNYEEWNSYISYGEECNHINKVCIFFKNEINLIHLISCRESDSKNSEYLNEVMSLVHDLPEEFQLIGRCHQHNLRRQYLLSCR